jgi:two-component system sensor histidine kinase AgrC
MESRRARHDFRHHRMVLQDMAARNDLHGIQTYLAEYNAEHADTPSKTYSNNPTVNAVVAYYAGHAEAAGIRFTARVQLPEQLLIPDPVFCVLLGNLLENAVDACKTELSRGALSGSASADANAGGLLTEAEAAEAGAGDSSTAAGTAIDPRAGVTASADVRSDQAIRVIVKQNGNAFLSIAVDNTCSRKPIWDDGELVSTKHEGHGVGTVSIRYIAQRYDGDARFEWRDGIFYASVMLNPQK